MLEYGRKYHHGSTGTQTYSSLGYWIPNADVYPEQTNIEIQNPHIYTTATELY